MAPIIVIAFKTDEVTNRVGYALCGVPRKLNSYCHTKASTPKPKCLSDSDFRSAQHMLHPEGVLRYIEQVKKVLEKKQTDLVSKVR